MLESKVEEVNHDVLALVKHAQALFLAAATMTGEKADEVRHRGLEILDTAMSQALDAKEGALLAGKDMACSADSYVQQNPWRAIATAAGLGLLAGLILGRCK